MPSRGKARKTGVRADIIPVVCPRQKGEFDRQGQEQRQVAPDAVGDVDGAVGALDRHVDVGAEDELAPGDVAEVCDQLAVARAVDDRLLLPAPERVRARRADEEVPLGREVDHHLRAARRAPRPPR